MGMRCSDTAVIYFDDVRVPAANIIGKEGVVAKSQKKALPIENGFNSFAFCH